MKWRKETLGHIAERITALGLRACPVCGSETLAAKARPVILPMGGSPWPSAHRPEPDPGSNILFMVAISCDLCGHTLLFDSEKFHHGDEYTLEHG